MITHIPLVSGNFPVKINFGYRVMANNYKLTLDMRIVRALIGEH